MSKEQQKLFLLTKNFVNMKAIFLYILLVLSLASVNILHAQVYESIRTGGWTQANTWLNGAIPPAQTEGITIKINEGHIVTFQDNGNAYRYGNNVVFDIEGVLNINGWGGFQIGNNAEFLVNGTLRNGQSMTVGQNATFKIWNSFAVASVFQTGNNADFVIYSNGIFNNTSSFTAGNNADMQVMGQLLNSGYKFEMGNDSGMEVTKDGFFNSSSTFVAGDNLDLIVDGVLNNSGHRFETGDDASFYITENASVTSTSSMSFGDELFLFVEGHLFIGGYNFSFGEDSGIFLLGNMEIDNHWAFKPSSDGNSYIYVCNGEESPTNLPQNSIVVENDCSVLPVELMYFEAIAIHNGVKLQWATASETNSDYFLIEKSRDGFHWTTVNMVKSAGNSNELLEYSIVDAVAQSGVVYYRLKQVDFNGAYEYFAPVAVELTSGEDFSFAAVLKRGEQVTIAGNFQMGGHLAAYTTDGRLLGEEVFTNETSSASFHFNEPCGIIILQYHHSVKGISETYKGFVR